MRLSANFQIVFWTCFWSLSLFVFQSHKTFYVEDATRTQQYLLSNDILHLTHWAICVLYLSNITLCEINVSNLAVCVLNVSDITRNLFFYERWPTSMWKNLSHQRLSMSGGLENGPKLHHKWSIIGSVMLLCSGNRTNIVYLKNPI